MSIVTGSGAQAVLVSVTPSHPAALPEIVVVPPPVVTKSTTGSKLQQVASFTLPEIEVSANTRNRPKAREGRKQGILLNIKVAAKRGERSKGR